MTTLASVDAGRCATNADQAIAYERHLGVRSAMALILHPMAELADAHRVLCGSVERQAFLAGCGRVTVEVTQ